MRQLRNWGKPRLRQPNGTKNTYSFAVTSSKPSGLSKFTRICSTSSPSKTKNSRNGSGRKSKWRGEPNTKRRLATSTWLFSHRTRWTTLIRQAAIGSSSATAKTKQSLEVRTRWQRVSNLRSLGVLVPTMVFRKVQCKNTQKELMHRVEIKISLTLNLQAPLKAKLCSYNTVKTMIN